MGLNLPLISIPDHINIILHYIILYYFWQENKEDDMFSFCSPRLIAATKFKYDYIIFEKT